MKKIILTDKEYDILIEELQSLWSYHWNSERISADDCESKVLSIIVELRTFVEERVEDVR